jgi:hypothetical protein
VCHGNVGVGNRLPHGIKLDVAEALPKKGYLLPSSSRELAGLSHLCETGTLFGGLLNTPSQSSPEPLSSKVGS